MLKHQMTQISIKAVEKGKGEDSGKRSGPSWSEYEASLQELLKSSLTSH